MQWDIAQSNVSVTVIKGDAHTPIVYEKVWSIMRDRKFDFIFIDSEHTDKAVKLETEMYQQFLKPCGIIAYHDICCIKEYLNSLDQKRIESYTKHPPFSDIGAPVSIGMVVYHAN